MANGLDKLERLFSTRKRAATNRHTTEANIIGIVPDPLRVAQTKTPAHAHARRPSDWQLQLQAQLQSPLQPESPLCHFPPSPFIRPKTSAMQPRNELSVSSPQSVAGTSSSSSRSPRLSSSTFSFDSSIKDTMSETNRQSTYSTTASFHSPTRTSSLLTRRHDRLPGGLIQLQLPCDTVSVDGSTNAPYFPDASVFPLKEESKDVQKCLLDALPIYPAPTVETPPPSDQDEFRFPSPPDRGREPCATLIQLTPEPSPNMIPQRDEVSNEPQSSSEIKRDTSTASPSKRMTASSVPLLEDDWRDSFIHETQASASPDARIVVREPAVEDFLALTYEDLAEVKVEHPSKPPSQRAPPPPVLPPSARSQSFTSALRSPIGASPALASSEVAAWEAARIAKKYDFDVVYIANFWPSRTMNHLHSPRAPARAAPTASASAPTSAVSSAHSSFSQRSFSGSFPPSPASGRLTTTNTSRSSTPRSSFQGATHPSLRSPPPPSDIFASSQPPSPATTDCCPRSGARAVRRARPGAMSGSLLAGYGLETIAAPFRLNSRVHKKILRTEGWIEHRRADAAENEFARGYARSFHTGSSAVASATAVAPAPVATVRHSAPEVGSARGKDVVPRSRGSDANEKIDRGIVFVAYRRPRGPGGTVHSSAAELDALEKEAETLVELILDFHKERRRWESLHEAARMASERMI